ncbi:uncharacterized protein [Amphiura filiformis]|uniref:uncharacterized protein n=1 Tax=Amphiura filiformis TaxID=82378 RepID=UPI003B21AC34
MLEWMQQRAEEQKICERGKHGFIVFDEIKIQGQLQLKKEGDSFSIAGFEELGELNDNLRCIRSGNLKAVVATHILQFTFNGVEGFHFPFAYWPTTQIKAEALFPLYWDAVFALNQKGFFVHMAICDGAQANRSFIINQFESSEAAVEANFTISNLVTVTHTYS